jgi:nitrite reductase/ring-hydroxylating ferredoxin subunit
VRVCAARDLEPGAVREYVVERRRVYVARVGDAFHAGEAKCTHAGCSLGQGALDGFELICLCHGSRFDVRSGAVAAPPARVPIAVFRTEVRDGDVYLNW